MGRRDPRGSDRRRPPAGAWLGVALAASRRRPGRSEVLPPPRPAAGGGGAVGRSRGRGGALFAMPRGRRGDPGGARPAFPRATWRRRRRRSTRWWRGIRRWGRSMPTVPGSRCCRGSRRRRSRCSRRRRRTASPASRGSRPTRSSPGSPASRGSRRSSPRRRWWCRPRSRTASRRSMPATPPGTRRPSGSSRASPFRGSRRPGCCRRERGRRRGTSWPSSGKRGRAAGNHGDLYDNRDRGHSKLDPGAHPQLAFVGYSEAARAADLDYGLNESLAFDHPTFGNSSTAITDGALWRSLPRSR